MQPTAESGRGTGTQMSHLAAICIISLKLGYEEATPPGPNGLIYNGVLLAEAAIRSSLMPRLASGVWLPRTLALMRVCLSVHRVVDVGVLSL